MNGSYDSVLGLAQPTAVAPRHAYTMKKYTYLEDGTEGQSQYVIFTPVTFQNLLLSFSALMIFPT